MTKLRSISLDELDHFQLDAQNNVYWKGQRLKTQVSLGLWVDLAIVAAGVGGFGVFILELAKALQWI